MSHPHPHAYGPPGSRGEPIGHVPHPPDEPLGEPSAVNRRLWVVAAVLAVIAVLAIVLTVQSVRNKHEARHATAAVSRACQQIQGLGQKCATAEPDEQAAAPQAVIPEPSVAGSLRPTVGASGSSGAPDESASQAGAPGGPMVNPGSDLIVGLTLRDHRLEITYADGTVVDAGRIEGAPPAIVLPVGSPAPASSGPPVPPLTPDISPGDIEPTAGSDPGDSPEQLPSGEQPFTDPSDESRYTP